jgi:hypothetical protein
MRPVIRRPTAGGGSGHLSSLSCCLSAAAVRFLAVLSRHRFPLPLRSAYRWLVSSTGPDGVSMFRTAEIRPVSGASCTPGPWCSHGRRGNFGHHCRISAAGPVLRCCLPPVGVLADEACRDSRHSPFPVFPLPVTDGWSVGPWASSRASHPAVTSDACQERGRALSTRPELTVEHVRPSISVVSLTQCDLTSHFHDPVASFVVVELGGAGQAGRQAGDPVHDLLAGPDTVQAAGVAA